MSILASQLLAGITIALQSSAPVRHWQDKTVHGLSDDSRTVSPGSAFVAVRGALHDGHDHIAAAIAAGAVLVLCERPVDARWLVAAGGPVPSVVIPNLSSLRSELGGRFYDHPSRALSLCAVTGTNGKTSVAHYIAQLARAMGRPAGYIGTVGWGLIERLQDAGLTTPDAISLQRWLRALADQHCEIAALEVSSHALDQQRIAALQVDVAIFTNLTRDHLDYHGSMARYAAAKRRLFERSELRAVVCNRDDAQGLDILKGARRRSSLTAVAYGSAADIGAGVDSDRPGLYWSDLEFLPEGLRGRFLGGWGTSSFTLPLLGEFAVANVAAALAALLVCDYDFEQLLDCAARLRGVPGRMELFRRDSRPGVVVDYAHTPDALAKALAALRRHSGARLLLVFGCGGDRDRGKRAQMGAVAARLADVVYVTSDNPRNEDPEAILADISAGMPADRPYHRITDRRDAITAAINAARADDLVLIAGKGHEEYQEIGAVRQPFSDRQLVRQLLEIAA